MKTTKSNELESVYEAAIQAITNPASGKLLKKGSLSRIFAPSFLAYGTAADEKCIGYNDFPKFLEKQRKQGMEAMVRMSMDCTPVFRSYSPDGKAAVYVDELRSFFVLDGVSHTSDLRVSIVLYKMEQGWRITHIHTSTSSSETDRGEQVPQQEWEKRNAVLEKAVEERTTALNESLERLEANRAQLIRQEKLASLGQLTAGIAHEIKNPLNFITNFSELSSEFIDEIEENIQKLESSEITEEIRALLKDTKVNLEKIHHHGSRADGIVKSMLLHSRGDSGKMEDTDLNSLVKEYVNLSFHGMRANKNPINVDIKIETDENLGPVKINPENFSRVILNLCKNAFDAMREKLQQETAVNYLPRLTIRTKSARDSVLVEIEDNGPGVPVEIRKKMMLPFFTTKKGSDGTGLGLGISQDIIKSHGGTLEIDSKEGESTRVTILLNRTE